VAPAVAVNNNNAEITRIRSPIISNNENGSQNTRREYDSNALARAELRRVTEICLAERRKRWGATKLGTNEPVRSCGGLNNGRKAQRKGRMHPTAGLYVCPVLNNQRTAAIVAAAALEWIDLGFVCSLRMQRFPHTTGMRCRCRDPEQHRRENPYEEKNQ
jgi:hypothetical protein